MNKGLTTKFLLFLPIKIIFLNLFYLHVMDFAYGYDLILLQEPNNILMNMELDLFNLLEIY